MSSLTGSFKYVFIPADDTLPIEEKEGPKSGGLSDDYLAKEAKRYFFEQSGGEARAAMIDNASSEERKALANQIREQVKQSEPAGGGGGDGASTNSRMSELDDDALIDIFRTAQTSATCEIVALTVPTPLNNHFAVSMYSADDARVRNLPVNNRAAALMEACGHPTRSASSSSSSGDEGSDNIGGGVCGDVFVGRCKDDERADVWERVDFTVKDADPNAEWCSVARKKGGGGGRGSSGKGSGAPSLSGVMSDALGRGGQYSALGAGGGGMGGEVERIDDGYKWSQTEDEVEMKFAVAPGTKAKYVKVKFGRTSLKVTVAGQTLVDGETGGELSVDDCTYTIQDDRGTGGRELCLTLGKKNGLNWNFAVRKK